MVAFELWETRSGNLMGSYESEARALGVVAEAIRLHGAEYADSMVLVRQTSRGNPKPIAAGAELAARAQAARTLTPGRIPA